MEQAFARVAGGVNRISRATRNRGGSKRATSRPDARSEFGERASATQGGRRPNDVGSGARLV